MAEPTMPLKDQQQRLRTLMDSHDFVIVGHRGASGLAPENTLQSFQTALDLQCPMIELDVYAVDAGNNQRELVVIHDDKVDRTTNGRGRVMHHNLQQLRSLDAGANQKIPLLEEVIELLRAHNRTKGALAALNVELKGPDTAAPMAAALAQWSDVPVLVSSFNPESLTYFRSLAPCSPVAPLYERRRKHWHTAAKDIDATAVNLGLKAATSKHIREIRTAGYPVLVYTVNSLAQARRLKLAGATGIFTDRPDLMRPLLERTNPDETESR